MVRGRLRVCILAVLDFDVHPDFRAARVLVGSVLLARFYWSLLNQFRSFPFCRVKVKKRPREGIELEVLPSQTRPVDNYKESKSLGSVLKLAFPRIPMRVRRTYALGLRFCSAQSSSLFERTAVPTLFALFFQLHTTRGFGMKVLFLNGAEDSHELVRRYATQWSECCAVRFR